MLADSGPLTSPLVARQDRSSTIAPPCPTGQTHRNRRLTEKDWRVTIGLDPCVPEPDAHRILRAINNNRLVNRQPAGAAGRLLDIPKIEVSQVLSIAVATEHELRVAPQARYVVTTRTSILSGLLLLVSVRGDDVDAHFVTAWVE